MKTEIVQRVRRHWRWLTAIAAAVLLYALIGFFWAPHFARGAIVDYVRNQLHRQIEIGDLTFNPFTLTAQVRHFALKEDDGTQILSFDALLVNAELVSIFYRGPAFKEIRIENPSVLLHVNADGSFNLAKLKPAEEAKPEEKPEAELPHIRIGRFVLHRGKVVVEDFSHPKPFQATLAPIEFSLVDFRTEPKFGNAYRFAASTEEDESLEWAGEFSMQPLGSRGRFTLENIKALTIASYLQDALPFDLPSGELDIQGEYRLAFSDRIDLQVTLPSVKARDFALASRANDESSPSITVPELSIVGTSMSLADRSLSIDDVQVIEPVIDAWRAPDGSVNLAQLFLGPSKPTEATAAPEPAPTEGSSWKIGVRNVQVENAHVNLEDRGVKPAAKFSLTPVKLKIANYSSERNAKLSLDASVGINDRGLLTLAGPASLSPLDADLKIDLKDFDLAPLQPYIAQSTDMTLKRGSVSLQSQVRYLAEPPKGQSQLKVSGDIEINDLLTKDNALEEDFIKWQSLKVGGINFQLGPDRLSIQSVRARKPYGRVIIASNSTINVAQVLNPKGAAKSNAPTPPPASKSKPMQIRIKNVAIEDGSASFADYSVTPSFATEMDGLKGSIEGLSSDNDSRAKVELTGSVDRYAPVSITGEINPLASSAFTDIAMNFRNIELTTFNPYSGKFAGYNIVKGKLSTEMHYKVENRKLDASHHIVVDQLEFGDATGSKDAVSLPVKLAVALLKDRHGVINLDLPVNGSLDDPSFRVGPIIWQVLKNTLEKIVTAPFALLGSLFGGGDEMAYVDFAPGSATLSPEMSSRLAKLKEAMIERPQLKLDIPLHVANDLDSRSVARAALDQAIAAKGKQDRLPALASIYSKEFGKSPTYPAVSEKKADVNAIRTRFLEDALLEKFAPTPAQLEALGRDRGNAVRDALVANSEIDAEHVFLSGRGAEASKDKEAVRMELKLE